MLSLALASRHQSRHLQAALTRGFLASSPTASSGSSAVGSWQKKQKMQQATTLVPEASRALSVSASRAMSDNHVRVWTAERVVAAINIPAVVVPFMYTNPITDAIFCTVFVLHGHWGIEAIAVDYVRPVLFGGNTLIPNLAQAAVWMLSAFTLGALYYFNYTDVGVVNAIKMLWKL